MVLIVAFAYRSCELKGNPVEIWGRRAAVRKVRNERTGADTAASRGKSLFLETASKPEDLPEYVALGFIVASN